PGGTAIPGGSWGRGKPHSVVSRTTTYMLSGTSRSWRAAPIPGVEGGGFVPCPTENEPGLAQCFLLLQGVGKLVADENPIVEHKKHPSGCAFFSVKKQFEELTLKRKEKKKEKIARETKSKQSEFEEAEKKVCYDTGQLAASE
uniref:Uncharacterized protein n=1 Tax=Peromyscus maniculatus bairdii TaxID=230844 RepID=A0A8C8UJU0_PERMB